MCIAIPFVGNGIEIPLVVLSKKILLQPKPSILKYIIKFACTECDYNSLSNVYYDLYIAIHTREIIYLCIVFNGCKKHLIKFYLPPYIIDIGFYYIKYIRVIDNIYLYNAFMFVNLIDYFGIRLYFVIFNITDG